MFMLVHNVFIYNICSFSNTFRVSTGVATWIVAVYVPVKFQKSTSTDGRVIKFSQKYKMAAVRHLELLFGNAEPPTKYAWCSEANRDQNG